MYQNLYSNPYSAHQSSFRPEVPGAVQGVFKLKVEGKGTVKISPDIATISIGVSTQDISLEKAQRENARITQQVINSIKKLGIPSKDIQTQAYVITPEYDYVDGKQVFRGYRVLNNLKVIVRDIQKVGLVIDTAVQSGANVVDNISFSASDTTRQYEQALKLAIEDAQGKARAIAEKLNVRLNMIPVEIVEQSIPESRPFFGVAAMKAAEASTPIEAGEIEITARIEATFNYTS
jgi:uncharacterized protein